MAKLADRKKTEDLMEIVTALGPFPVGFPQKLQ